MNQVLRIGDRLKGFREYLGKNQKEFSNMMLISQQSLSKYENGSLNIPDKIKVHLFEFGVNLTWLLTGSGEMLAHPPTIGERLKKSRIKFTLEPHEISEFMGIPEKKYLAMENNEIIPTEEELKKLQGNTTISRDWILTGAGSMLDYEPNPPSSDDPVVKSFIKAHAEIYKILNEYRGLKRQMESTTPAPENTGCSLCEMYHRLDTKRQMKAEGYVEGLLREQEGEQDAEANGAEAG